MSPKTKQCTNCNQHLPLDDYYSKGDRLDSRCKNCVKETKKSRYVLKEKVISLENLFKIFEIISEIEIKAIKKWNHKLDLEIEKCQNKIIEPLPFREFPVMSKAKDLV